MKNNSPHQFVYYRSCQTKLFLFMTR